MSFTNTIFLIIYFGFDKLWIITYNLYDKKPHDLKLFTLKFQKINIKILSDGYRVYFKKFQKFQKKIVYYPSATPTVITF